MKKTEQKAKKKKKSNDKTHIYYVTDVLFWQVMVLRYELVKKTSKYAIVLDSTEKQKRLVLDDQDGVVCDTKDEALKQAKKRLKAKREKLREYKKQLDTSKEELKTGRVRIIKPQKLDLSALNEGDYKF